MTIRKFNSLTLLLTAIFFVLSGLNYYIAGDNTLWFQRTALGVILFGLYAIHREL